MSGEHPRATTNTIACGGTHILQNAATRTHRHACPRVGIKLYKLCEAMANFAHTRQTNARASFLPVESI
jgi:hypothetical protein